MIRAVEQEVGVQLFPSDSSSKGPKDEMKLGDVTETGLSHEAQPETK